MPTLENQVAVVTGAGRGIGRAIALAFARAGAAVVCTARTTSEIEETASLIQAEGWNAIAVGADVTAAAAIELLFSATSARFGGLDILVVNAGVSGEHLRVDESQPEEWISTLTVNLVGAYLCAKAAIPYFRARGAGKIIMLGSAGTSRPAGDLCLRMLEGGPLDAHARAGAGAN